MAGYVNIKRNTGRKIVFRILNHSKYRESIRMAADARRHMAVETVVSGSKLLIIEQPG